MPKQKKTKPKVNTWALVSVALAVLLAISVSFNISSNFSPTITGMNILNQEDAAEKAIVYINSLGVTPELIDINETKGLYELSMRIQNQPYLVYMTKDGSLLFPQVLVLSDIISEETGPPKAERPNVDLYIFSYCPAGSAALDAFAPVAESLKEKADFRVRFFSHMHGEYEMQQNIVQECIQEVAPDKYWAYANDFLEVIYQTCGPTGDLECDMDESISLMEEKGIDSNEVLACVENMGNDLYNTDIQMAGALDLRYSPSFVINGEYMQNVDRSPDGIKNAVCSVFIEQPSECGETMSQQAQSAGSCA